jgi:DNA-binding PadR family transcriptional regulator
MNSVKRLNSEGVFSLGRGTLYPLLYNLESKGLVAAEWEDNEGNRKRRYYSITSKGKTELDAQKEQWLALQRGVNFVFGFEGLSMA